MKTWKEFLSYTHIKESKWSLFLMLALLSFLYCSLYQTVIYFAGRSGDRIAWYVFHYLLIMISAYVYMIVMFQFIRTKRKDSSDLKMKQYLIPIFGVQTILFILLAGSSFLSFQFMMIGMKQANVVMTPIMLILMMFYIPVQVFACFAIYDGARNPLVILKDAVMKIIHHYRSVFYSMLILLLVAVIYNFAMEAFFQYGYLFSPSTAVMDIMVRSNPLTDALELGLSLSGNSQLIAPFILALCYGLVMSFILIYYYMFMVCIFDDDVHV